MVRVLIFVLSLGVTGHSNSEGGHHHASHKHSHGKKKKHKHHHHKGKKKRRGHSAHVHGAVHMSMVADKKALQVSLEAPAASILGFEYKAKSAKEKKVVKDFKNNFKNNFLTYLGSDRLSDCKVVNSKIDQKFEGKGHSTIYAVTTVKCQKAIGKRKLSVSLKRHYDHIDYIQVKLIRHDGSVLKKEFEKKIFEIVL